tara:strand:+ start:2257 stop:2784 length:528 start_codon:yes stop_codon:yes gene_type:complete
MVLSDIRTGTYIGRIYKKYRVVDDISEKISKFIHNDYMKVICWVMKELLRLSILNKNDDGYDKGIRYNNKKKFMEKAFLYNCDTKVLLEHIAHSEKTKLESLNYMDWGYYDKKERFINGFTRMNEFDNTFIDNNKFKMRGGYSLSEIRKIFRENRWEHEEFWSKKKFIHEFFKME